MTFQYHKNTPTFVNELLQSELEEQSVKQIEFRCFLMEPMLALEQNISMKNCPIGRRFSDLLNFHIFLQDLWH